MAQVPTTSPARMAKDGYLDNVYSVFKARQHPIVIVEESAFRWMGLRVPPQEDLDLLIKSSEMEAIEADLLATGGFERVEQNLKLRFNDPYTQQVPRLRRKPDPRISYKCISLWSEDVYMLDVDGERIEVPDALAWKAVLIEDRFDLRPPWAQADSISYSTKIADGVQVLAPLLTQSADMKYPICIPTIPRMLNALLDQVHYCITYAEEFPPGAGNRPFYRLNAFVRHLHFEKPQQRGRLLPELADNNRQAMELICNKFRRKPQITVASLLN